MVLGTADAAKWVSRQKNRLPQPRATISTSMAAGRCGRPTAEAAERRLEAGVFAAFQTSDGGSVDFAEWVKGFQWSFTATLAATAAFLTTESSTSRSMRRFCATSFMLNVGTPPQLGMDETGWSA